MTPSDDKSQLGFDILKIRVTSERRLRQGYFLQSGLDGPHLAVSPFCDVTI